MPPVLRSILAVIGGFVAMSFAVTVLRVLALAPLHGPGSHPGTAYYATNVVYSLLGALAGGFAAGLIAGRKPLQHGYVLGGVMVAMGLLALARVHGLQPAWYEAVMVFGPPACAVGGAGIFAMSVRRHEV